jgi:hypothetical protein
MMVEAEWQRSQYVPTVEEYMSNAVVSFALGPIVLPALYFVGERLFENVAQDEECSELFKLLSTCGRLLNDIQGFEVFGILSNRKVHFTADSAHIYLPTRHGMPSLEISTVYFMLYPKIWHTLHLILKLLRLLETLLFLTGTKICFRFLFLFIISMFEKSTTDLSLTNHWLTTAERGMRGEAE